MGGGGLASLRLLWHTLSLRRFGTLCRQRSHWDASALYVVAPHWRALAWHFVSGLAAIPHCGSGLWPEALAAALTCSVIATLRHTLPSHRIGALWFGTSC